MKYAQEGPVFVFTSPHLFDEVTGPLRLYECPVGKVLRETPYIYDLFSSLGLFENATPNEWRTTPRFVQRLASLFSSEVARLRTLEREQAKGYSDANYGARVRAQRG